MTCVAVPGRRGRSATDLPSQPGGPSVASTWSWVRVCHWSFAGRDAGSPITCEDGQLWLGKPPRWVTRLRSAFRHLGVKRAGENLGRHDARTTGRSFLAQAALLLGSQGPWASLVSLQRLESGHSSHLLASQPLVFAFCPSPCPPEALPLEIWMEISSLPLPPSIILCRCKLSWKRHLAASPLGPGTAGHTRVSLTLARGPWGGGILLGLATLAFVLEGGSWFCWWVRSTPN